MDTLKAHRALENKESLASKIERWDEEAFKILYIKNLKGILSSEAFVKEVGRLLAAAPRPALRSCSELRFHQLWRRSEELAKLPEQGTDQKGFRKAGRRCSGEDCQSPQAVRLENDLAVLVPKARRARLCANGGLEGACLEAWPFGSRKRAGAVSAAALLLRSRSRKLQELKTSRLIGLRLFMKVGRSPKAPGARLYGMSRPCGRKPWPSSGVPQMWHSMCRATGTLDACRMPFGTTAVMNVFL